MRVSITCLFLLLLTAFGSIQAQVPKDIAIPISVSVNLAPASVTLNFPNPAPSTLLILRRTKGQAGNQWIQILNQANSTITTYTDNSAVALGQTYEYVIQRTEASVSIGYAHVAVRAPVVDNRGKILVIVDSTTADALGVELVRLKNDMRGDGWIATPLKIGPAATVQSVKAQIVAAYTADPLNMKAVLLIGSVPVPYAGATNWDVHPDHTGAWPADSYYAELNGTWTDVSVNNDTSGRVANHNVPGDGKFDQSILPSQVEVQVGRIDFRNIDAAAFGEANTIGLIRRYLDKDHAWRTGAYQVQNKALIDDNFGILQGGEAPALSGFLNAYPLVGAANVVETDFFTSSESQNWLMGYGCGGGNYQGAGGIGSSTDFATKTVNIVFTHLFGSYFGDWGYEINPFMPAALASRGGILTCSWSARPHWFEQALASGETIGYCHKETQNAQYNNGFFGTYGESGTHTALLGDPTLRANVVQPPTNVAVTSACNGVKIDWTASAEQVDGYHVYRSLSNDGPYTRISSNLVSGTTFSDNNPILDTLFYQVRAIRTHSTPGGGIYVNNSVGPIAYLVYSPGTPPTVAVVGGTLTCATQTVGLAVNSNAPIASWAWTGPFGVTSSDTVFHVSLPGNYSVVVTDVNGCTAEGSSFVDQNTIPPVLNISSTNILTCLVPTTTLSVTSSSPLDNSSFQWSNGATSPSITVGQALNYEVFANSVDNGCPGSAVIAVAEDIAPPVVDFPEQVTYNCINTCATISLPAVADYEYYLDLQPVTDNQVVLCNAGFYSITTISTHNGCSTNSDVEVLSDVNAPGAAIGGSGTLTCQVNSIQLMGSSSVSDVSYHWSGPGINATNENQQNPTVYEPGIYVLTVTDNVNGCTSTDQFEIFSDGSIPIISATGGSITCIVPSVTLTCTSNFPNSTFEWSGPGGFFSTDQNPLTTFPGLYTVIVTSPNGCSTSAVVEVLDEAQLPEYGIPPIPQLNCANPCVTVQLIPLTPGLEIPPMTVCAPGTYVVTISGANGCTTDATFSVTQAPPFSAALEPAFVDCDGSITLSVVATGGTEPYSYLWSNGSTLFTALFLLDGTPISVTVSDSGGCVWVSETLTIAAPPPLVVASNITDEIMGQHNGAILLTLTGGTGPFGFHWSNNATTQNLTGLAGGTYSVTITELGTGCTTEASFTVHTITVGASEPAFVQNFTLAPNPAAGVATLSLELTEQLPVKVEVRDALGRLILDNPVVTVKNLSLPIDLTQQAAGVYNVSVVVDNQVFVRKLVVVK